MNINNTIIYRYPLKKTNMYLLVNNIFTLNNHLIFLFIYYFYITSFQM